MSSPPALPSVVIHTMTQDVKSKGGPLPQPSWPSSMLASNLAHCSPHPLGMGDALNEPAREQATGSDPLSQVTAVDVAQATGEQGGCPTLAWQRVGAHPSILPSPSSPSVQAALAWPPPDHRFQYFAPASPPSQFPWE